MKLYVACAVCSVRRVHGAGYGRAEHICSRGEPLGLRGLLLEMCRVTSWLHMWFGIRQEGKSLPDGAVHEGTRYTCSCMTSRARSKVRGRELLRKVRELRRWSYAFKKKKKMMNWRTKASLAFG